MTDPAKGALPALESAATGDGWQGKWRAAQAWELTFETPIIMALVVYKLMIGDQFIVDALAKLIPVITLYLTCRYAVLGVHVWRGSVERTVGMQAVQQDSSAN